MGFVIRAMVIESVRSRVSEVEMDPEDGSVLSLRQRMLSFPLSGVGVERLGDLRAVGGASHLLRLFARLGEDGEEYRGENRYDSDDDESSMSVNALLV